MSIARTSWRRTYSFVSTADHTAVAGILSSQSTAVTQQVYSASDFNGSLVLTGGVLKPSRMVTITRSLATGAYTTDPIVLVGNRGDLINLNIAQPTADGGDTLTSGILVDRIASITFPPMASTGGSIQIGVEDVGAPAGGELAGVRMAAAGIMPVAYDHQGLETDTIDAGIEIHPIAAKRVATSTITQGFTIYLP